MIGLIKPSSGTAYVQGLDIWSQMDSIYTSMGVCPQHEYALMLFIILIYYKQFRLFLFISLSPTCLPFTMLNVYSLLWETLTGREHLLFYGRLKNLKGAALTQVSNVVFDLAT